MLNYLCEKPLIYMSHAITGSTGKVEENCKKAHTIAKKLRVLFPEVSFYCPGENDWVIQTLYNAGKLSVDKILWADLEILSECNGWVFFKWDESGGCERERKWAERYGLEREDSTIVDNAAKMNYTSLRRRMLPIVTDAIRHFRSNR